MASSLATKQNLQMIETRLEALESRVALMLQNLESRLVMKLGVVMTLLFGVAGALLSLLR